MLEASKTVDTFDLLDPEVRANPYPFYHWLQSEDPVHWSESWRGWLLTRYEDVASALRDARLAAGGAVAAMFEKLPQADQEELLPLRRHLSMWMGNLDPPDHTRIRSLMQKGFTPRLVESMRSFTQTVADELVDKIGEAGHLEAVGDLAYPLPAIVIANMLGTPPEDRDRFRKWSDDLTEFLGYGFLRMDVLRSAQNTVLEMTDYLARISEQLRRNGWKNDLIGSLVAAREYGSSLTEEEMLANCVLLLFAGHETTTILIGNSLLALLQNPDQLQELRDDPSLAPNAVEEFLRYDSPLQMIRRSAKQDLEIRGKKIDKGQLVWLVLGAANRDPAQFPDPDRLIIQRRENRHLAFGSGPHFCLGAMLSSVETQVAVTTVLRRMPALQLGTATLEWLNNPTARALKSLPVRF